MHAGDAVGCMILSLWWKRKCWATDSCWEQTNRFSLSDEETLFTLLTFPLRWALDIEQSGRGPLFTGPSANEAIKRVLPGMSKGPQSGSNASAGPASSRVCALLQAEGRSAVVQRRPACSGPGTSAHLWAQLEIRQQSKTRFPRSFGAPEGLEAINNSSFSPCCDWTTPGTKRKS